MSNLGACSWFEFARETLIAAGVAAQMAPVDTGESPGVRRPSYSALTSKRLTSVGVDPPQRWQESLTHYLAEIGELSVLQNEALR